METISREFQNASSKPTTNENVLPEMTAEQLMSYVLIHHHFYVKQSILRYLGIWRK